MSDAIELSPEEQEKATEANSHDRAANSSDRTVDPRDLVRTGGYPQDVRDAVESPMVTPELPNEPGDLRGDTLEED